MPVLFHFKPGGKVEVKPTGYPGGECRQMTAALTKGMGKTVADIPTEEAALPERHRQIETERLREGQ